MKIELEEPFASKWSKGYIVVNSENRRNVVLYNSENDRTTISYARYLMSVKLGYEVPDHLEVDHRDDDKTNDDINNLQLLTPEENKDKENKRRAEITVAKQTVICKNCNCSFEIDTSYYNKKIKAGNSNIFCSVKCRSLFIKPPSQKIPEELIIKINNLTASGFTTKEITEQTNLSRSTIKKYKSLNLKNTIDTV